MELFLLVAVVGALASLVGWVWLVVLGFGEGIGWGIGCLLCSPVALVFGVTHLDRAGVPLGLHVVGSLASWGAMQLAQGTLGAH